MTAFNYSDIVQTTSGPVVGRRIEALDLSAWLGIPYAQPPVGNLRFKPTVPVKPWIEVREALKFSPPSMQVCFPDMDVSDFVDQPQQPALGCIGSEDSLTLNVWRPNAASQHKRPLFIWIHGGANHLEGSRSRMYNGEMLASKGDLVFASLNYRLGPLGFMDVSELGGVEYAGSSCNGLRDQLTAVEWILDNAEAFGADPDNVTLAGESAGGMDISWLLASGRLKGRIKRAIIMSNVKGPCGFGENTDGMSRHDKRFSQRIARQLLQRLDYENFEALRSAPADELFQRLATRSADSDLIFDLDGLFYPCVDDSFASEEPFRAIRSGQLDGLDVMIGYTNYEAGLWLMMEPAMLDWPAQKMADRFGNLGEQVKADIVEAYRQFHPQLDEGQLGMTIMSDCGFVFPQIWFAEELVKRGNKVWMYRFDWPVNDTLKAMHSAELPFFFGRPNDEAAGDVIGKPASHAIAAERLQLSHEFCQRVISFARQGLPKPNALTSGHLWPTYDLDQRPMLRLDLQPEIIHDPDANKRQWWTSRVYSPVMNPAEE
ncbi:carboxylesterase/lipase family protein [Oceanobacter mangrovi]|uniref:carboxylesterase/lipase family protein n=1 Tax=Oceanobacter mangrovi TaxID=2862510 RepID=UPI001C8CF978|nr:carboxylesterase family protein [Oceanobacter mangrovi]